MKPLLGIDLGGTKIAVAAVIDGKIIAKIVVPTPRPPSSGGQTAVFQAIIDASQQVMAQVGQPASIGLGLPGPIDFARGVVKFAPNIPGFEEAPIRRVLEEAFGQAVELENDANAAGLAEHAFGAGRGASSSVFITISTGVGSGIIINNQIWRGAHGIAGEVGHTVVLPGGPMAGSGFDGALEALASGSAIARDASFVFGRNVSTAEVFATNDAKAKKIVEVAARHLGIAIANLQKIIDPELFIIGGGVMDQPSFLEQIKVIAEEYTKGFAPVVIRKALLGTDAGVIGAALSGKQNSTNL